MLGFWTRWLDTPPPKSGTSRNVNAVYFFGSDLPSVLLLVSKLWTLRQHQTQTSFPNCSSQPSMVQWLSSSIFPCSFFCLFVRPAMVTSSPLPLLLAPDPPNPYIFWKLMIRAIQKWIGNTNTRTNTITKTMTKTTHDDERITEWITNSVLYFRNPDDSSIPRMTVDTSPWSTSSALSAPSAPSAPQPLTRSQTSHPPKKILWKWFEMMRNLVRSLFCHLPSSGG